MNIDLALEKIYSLKQFHIKLGLDNIKDLLDHLDNPQKNLKSIHVAGSNGKGSTCSFISSILMESGYKVGLYTSPHFVRFNERIRINGEEIPDFEIINFLKLNKEYIDINKPTFFEITTALAFNYFKDKKVDFAVIETGLGGRLDATNVLNPLASVITSISLEHSHILGDSLDKIAYEKGGIIKDGIPVFIADMNRIAEENLVNIAAERNSPITLLRNNWNKKTGSITLKQGSIVINNTGLIGKHQLDNAALAMLTLNYLLNIDDNEIITKGLNNIVSNSGIQGRYEKIGPRENIIIDAAHNLEGVKIFIDEFKREYQSYENKTLIFGAMSDKDIANMLLILNPFFDNIYVTSANIERATPVDTIIKISESIGIHSEEVENIDEILNRHLLKKCKDCLVILGSIYLLGEIKKTIIGQN